MLQSAVTAAAHGGNNGDHIHISTGDSSVLDSQSSIQDKTTTSESKQKSIASGKSESRRTSATKNTAKTTGNHTTTSKGQSVVLKGLNKLKDLQRQSLTSMNEMISTMTVAVETLTQTKTSLKRKRDEMIESESSDQESNQEDSTAMAGNPPGDISSQVNDLLRTNESSKNSSKANEDEVLGELSKLYKSEGMVSDPINAKLTSLVDKMVKTSLSEEKTKEKHEKYNRPENCENLINTRVNPEIWSKVRSNTRSRDLKMQKLETSLLKSMIPIVKMSDKLLELKSSSESASKSDVSEFLQLSLDSLALMGHSINEVNIKRRELIKPDLDDQFKQLCGLQTPVTKLLIGDDLPKSVKEISETIKVGVNVSSKQPHYNKQQKRSNFSHRPHHQNQKPFFMEIPRAREEITPGPQKEGETRSTLTVDNAQDHLNFQVSLSNDIHHNTAVNVPYVAGRLKQFVLVWQTITFDYFILSSIKGVKIEFVEYPKQTMIPREYNFDATELVIIDRQIEKFLQTGVIEKTTHREGEYISNIFIQPKKDGSYRLILNLKYLNQFVQYHHFKMENLKLVPLL